LSGTIVLLLATYTASNVYRQGIPSSKSRAGRSKLIVEQILRDLDHHPGLSVGHSALSTP
jgi:hypothetical protein